MTSDFFEFIVKVESTFIINATLEMMMAYCDGSLFDKIKDALTQNKSIFEEFKCKLRLIDYEDEVIRKLLVEILTTYRNIRSGWFINSVKGQEPRGGKKDQSTRERVRESAYVAKAKAEAVADIKAKLDLKKRADTDAQAKLAATADAAAGNMYLKAVENFDKNIDEIDDDDSDKMD